MLGISEGMFHRWRPRCNAEGTDGVVGQRLNRGSARVLSVDDALGMETVYEVYEPQYRGWR